MELIYTVNECDGRTITITNYKRITTHKSWISTKMNISYKLHVICYMLYVIYYVSLAPTRSSKMNVAYVYLVDQIILHTTSR